MLGTKFHNEIQQNSKQNVQQLVQQIVQQKYSNLCLSG